MQKAKRGATDPTCCLELWQPCTDSGNKYITSPFPTDFLWTLLHQIRETNSKCWGNSPAGSQSSRLDEGIWMIDQWTARFDGPVRGWRNPLRCAPEETLEGVGGESSWALNRSCHTAACRLKTAIAQTVDKSQTRQTAASSRQEKNLGLCLKEFCTVVNRAIWERGGLAPRASSAASARLVSCIWLRFCRFFCCSRQPL